MEHCSFTSLLCLFNHASPEIPHKHLALMFFFSLMFIHQNELKLARKACTKNSHRFQESSQRAAHPFFFWPFFFLTHAVTMMVWRHDTRSSSCVCNSHRFSLSVRVSRGCRRRTITSSSCHLGFES